MNEIRLSITLPRDKYLALESAGAVECRRPRDHARYLLLQALGLANEDSQSDPMHSRADESLRDTSAAVA